MPEPDKPVEIEEVKKEPENEPVKTEQTEKPDPVKADSPVPEPAKAPTPEPESVEVKSPSPEPVKVKAPSPETEKAPTPEPEPVNVIAKKPEEAPVVEFKGPKAPEILADGALSDQQKFEALSELIKHNAISNKEVVNAVLFLVRPPSLFSSEPSFSLGHTV